MFADYGRPTLFAALLATALSGACVGKRQHNHRATTGIGRAGPRPRRASQQTSPVVVQESFATVTNGNAAAPRAACQVPDVRPTPSP
jgi:hypothetical protein